MAYALLPSGTWVTQDILTEEDMQHDISCLARKLASYVMGLPIFPACAAALVCVGVSVIESLGQA